jgi:hypothetical protein
VTAVGYYNRKTGYRTVIVKRAVTTGDSWWDNITAKRDNITAKRDNITSKRDIHRNRKLEITTGVDTP